MQPEKRKREELKEGRKGERERGSGEWEERVWEREGKKRKKGEVGDQEERGGGKRIL